MAVGGQAVIEGVLLQNGRQAVVAVRTPEGTVAVEPLSLRSFPRLENLPLLRGPIRLYQLLSLGFSALERSSQLAFPEEASSRGGYILAIILALLLVIGGFIALPFFLASLTGITNTVLLSLVEGGFRVAFFLLYLWGISFLPDVRRVFQYHGAEHKVVHAYEEGAPSLETAVRKSTIHPRCGTNFVLLFVVVAVLLFSVIPAPSLWLRLVLRIGLIPVVASVTYELLQLGAKRGWLRPLLWPGLLLQRITTREPTSDQLEVALAALHQVTTLRSSSTTA